MKICTMNIWNSDINFDKRMALVEDLINLHQVDILALQEVRNENIAKKIAEKASMKHCVYSQYLDYGEGLAIISKYPINHIVNNFEEAPDYNSGIQRGVIQIQDYEIGITNVHLDYKLEENRLLGLDKAFDLIESNTKEIEILLGDFNVDAESNIHFELRMDDFDDLYQTYCFKRNIFPEPTIDFDNNPRWKENPTDEIPSRFDWIFLHTKHKYSVIDAEIIGKEETNGITPSDHYGVVVDVKLDK